MTPGPTRLLAKVPLVAVGGLSRRRHGRRPCTSATPLPSGSLAVLKNAPQPVSVAVQEDATWVGVSIPPAGTGGPGWSPVPAAGAAVLPGPLPLTHVICAGWIFVYDLLLKTLNAKPQLLSLPAIVSIFLDLTKCRKELVELMLTSPLVFEVVLGAPRPLPASLPQPPPAPPLLAA